MFLWPGRREGIQVCELVVLKDETGAKRTMAVAIQDRSGELSSLQLFGTGEYEPEYWICPDCSSQVPVDLAADHDCEARRLRMLFEG